MDAILYISQAVFEAIIYIATAGMGATVVLLLVILFREFKNHTLW